MTYGTITGILLSDLIQDRENAWASLYDPSRKTLKAANEFASENLNVAAQYCDWFKVDHSKNDGMSFEAGTGTVIHRGLKKIAVYCDELGQLHKCSAVCPHLGCIVAWNHSELSWDCPCHGSRFDKFGKVINGPAVRNLQSLKEPLAE